MKPSAIVTTAIDLIEERGWERRQYQSSDGRLCIVGALRIAAGESLFDGGSGIPQTQPGPNNAAFLDAYWALTSTISKGNVVQWNDNIAKNKQEVIDVLHQTAVHLDRQGK